MFKKKFAALLLLVSLGQTAFAAGVDELQKGFQTPPADARPMMRWWWFGASVTKAEIERELRTMRDGGIGGVEIQPVYPLLPDDPKAGIKNLPYLSDEFLQMLRFAGDKAKELGMRTDVTLGSGWSFGGATTPITEAAGQIRFDRVKIDSNTRRVPLPSMIAAEKLHGVFIATVNGNAIAEGSLKELTDIRDDNVFLPAGSTGNEVLFFIGGKSGMQVKRPSVGGEGYVLNHLDKPSVEGYLRKTGDRLFSAFPKTNIPFAFFCDSLEVYNQDWTDGFLEEFKKRRGYDLKPYLPALALDMGPKTAEIRYDWGRTLTEVFNENFMMPMQAWGKKNGSKFRIQGYGIPSAAISSNKWADISDGEGAQWKVVRAARWASSANHIYGRNVTSSETWTWLHSPSFRATPLDMKAEADIHFLQGINQLIGHGWAYTPPQVEYPGWRFYAAGEYSDRNPWWIVMPDLTKYLQRMSWLMRQGTQTNDVALYLPNADSYAHFSASKVHLIDIERERVGEQIMPSIFEAGYNLNFFDDEMLQIDGKVEKDALTLGVAKHRAVVLPGIERMPLASLRKLDEFVKNGGIVVASRRKPEIVPGLKATDAEQSEMKATVARLFGGSNPRVAFVATDTEVGPALKKLLRPDLEISEPKDFGFVHRSTPNAEIYFVANTSNRKREVKLAFRTVGDTQIWDAMNGKTGAGLMTVDNNVMTSEASFEPYQSKVYVIDKTKSPRLLNDGDASLRQFPLNGGWTVAFGDKPAKPLSAFTSWTDDEATRFYSGTASYQKSFELTADQTSSSLMLDFGEAKSLDFEPQKNGMATYLDAPVKEAAVVYVNGVRAGSVWAPPYRLDIKPFVKPGANTLKIVVANTAVNYMAGRRLPDYKLLNLRFGERFQPQEMEKVMAYPSGLMSAPRVITF